MQLICISKFKEVYCNPVALIWFLRDMTSKHSDSVGILASSICLVHCLATPLLFVVKSCAHASCEAAPMWWQMLDYVFLAIAAAAIVTTKSNTQFAWLKSSLWLSWFGLLAVLLSHSLEIIHISTIVSYIPPLLIVALHTLNVVTQRKSTHSCCTV